jgi:hypothetical protein
MESGTGDSICGESWTVCAYSPRPVRLCGIHVWRDSRVVTTPVPKHVDAAMSDFVTQTTTYLKEQHLFSYQGGPIVLAQIENEIGGNTVDEATENLMQVDLDGSFVESSSEQRRMDGIGSGLRNATLQDYATWCGTLAQSLVPFVVWTMCSGLSANNTVATYNGFFDDVGWIKRHGESGRVLLDQPAMWTEAEGMFQGTLQATAWCRQRLSNSLAHLQLAG